MSSPGQLASITESAPASGAQHPPSLPLKEKGVFSSCDPSLAGDNNVSKSQSLQQAAALLFVFRAGHADSELQARLIAIAQCMLGLGKSPHHQ